MVSIIPDTQWQEEITSLKKELNAEILKIAAMAISDKKNNFLIDHQTLKIMKFNIGIIMS